jgi:hypothetical protein
MAAIDSTRHPVPARGLLRLPHVPRAGVPVAAALVAAAALFPVVQNSTTTTAGYETRRLERQRADLQAAIWGAQHEIARLGSLERIDQEARGRLGMVPADRTVVIAVAEPAPAGGTVPARFLPRAPAPAPARPAAGLRGWIDRLFGR